FVRTRLLALENTWHGLPLPLDYLAHAGAFARERGLAFHLDGARLYNAAVACGVPAAQIAGHFDSVSVCLSKGLGAPVGSGLADDARGAVGLAAALKALGLTVAGAFTTSLFVAGPGGRAAELAKALEARGVRIAAGRGARVRLVTQLDIGDAGLERAITGFRE